MRGPVFTHTFLIVMIHIPKDCEEGYLFSSKAAWTQVLGTDDLLSVDRVVQRHFSVEEAKAAREVFLAGSSLPILPVVVWDDVNIGEGVPGRGVLSLKALLLNHMNPANNRGQHTEVPYGWLTGAE